MKAIVNGIIMGPHEEIRGKALFFDEQVVAVAGFEQFKADEVYNAGGAYVSPGLIDLHIHGYAGFDASDGSEEGIRNIARSLLANGVTSFLPTTMTLAWSELEKAFRIIRGLMPLSRAKDFDGAEILGCHAEGPFINPLRKGAQAADHILSPDAQKVLPYKDVIRILTVAPEVPGGIAFIKELAAASDIVVAIGHTAASFEQTEEAISAGARHITHLFNAMTPLSHRAPGTVGAALTRDVSCELIADTFHVHPGLFPLLRLAKGDRLVLVSDCTRAGGLPDGEYSLGGQPIFVRGIECRLSDGTIAGGVLRLNDAAGNYYKHGGMSRLQALQAASLNAARVIGADGRKGSLEAGKDADIVLMDADFRVRAAFVRGAMKYSR